MIAFNNGVTNVLETPGIIADTVINQPAATAVAVGTLYIQTDAGKIERSNGSTWDSIGGGGSTPGIDDVLAVGQALTVNRVIETAGNTLYFTNSLLPLASFNWNEIILGDDDGFVLHNTLHIDQVNRVLYTMEGAIAKGIRLDYNNSQYWIGDEIYFIQVDSNNENIETFTNSSKYGLKITKDNTTVGDYNGLSSVIFVDTPSSQIYTIFNSDNIGINLDGNNDIYYFGDFDGISGKNKIIVDNNAKIITIDTDTGTLSAKMNAIEFNGSITTGTSGSTSGQHLQIRINGTDYVIELKKP
jgi:hypothetical protein